MKISIEEMEVFNARPVALLHELENWIADNPNSLSVNGVYRV